MANSRTDKEHLECLTLFPNRATQRSGFHSSDARLFQCSAGPISESRSDRESLSPCRKHCSANNVLRTVRHPGQHWQKLVHLNKREQQKKKHIQPVWRPVETLIQSLSLLTKLSMNRFRIEFAAAVRHKVRLSRCSEQRLSPAGKSSFCSLKTRPLQANPAGRTSHLITMITMLFKGTLFWSN